MPRPPGPGFRLAAFALLLAPVAQALLQLKLGGAPLWGLEGIPEGNLFHHQAALDVLQRGTTAEDFQPPGYGALVALVYALLGPDPGWVKIVQIGLLPGIVAATAALGQAVGGRRVALLAAGIAALHPALPRYALQLHGDLLACLGVATFAAGSFGVLHRGRGSPALAALGLALAVWVRPTWALLLPSLALVALVGSGWARTSRALALPALAVVAALGLNLALFPPGDREPLRGSHAASSSLLLGTFQYEDRLWDWDFVGPGDPTWERYARFRDSVVASVPGKGKPHPEVRAALRAAAWERYREPRRLLRKVGISELRLWILFPTGAARRVQWALAALDGLILLLALLGVLRLEARALPLLGLLAVPMALHAVLHVEPRYGVPVRCALWVLAAVGVAGLPKGLRRKAPGG